MSGCTAILQVTAGRKNRHVPAGFGPDGSARFSELHMIPQHQLLGIRMQVHLLVHPVGHRIAVQGRTLKARALAEAAPPEVAAASAVAL
jgi:hypothetical protein